MWQHILRLVTSCLARKPNPGRVDQRLDARDEACMHTIDSVVERDINNWQPDVNGLLNDYASVISSKIWQVHTFPGDDKSTH